MIMNPDPLLTLGAVNLIGTVDEYVANGYRFEALGDDTDWGNPVPIDVKVISWLQDGAIVDRQGYDNREILVRVRIVAEDSNSLAVAESALMLETGKPNLLTWTPPDGQGEPCVFSVVMSNLEQVFDDFEEVQVKPNRTYGLRIQAEPFVRALEMVSVSIPAPSGSQSLTVVDDCTTFTGWAGTADAASTSTGAGVFVTGNGMANGFRELKLIRTGLTADLTTTPYLRVETSMFSSSGFAGPSSLIFKFNGIALSPTQQDSNFYWFDTTGTGIGTTLNTVEVIRSLYTGTSHPDITHLVGDITRSNVLGFVGTGRQLARTIPVAGSARTQGNLYVADASDALGETLVYTCPAATGIVQPNLRQFLTSGNALTSEPTYISGFSSDLNEDHVFEIPVTGLPPGGYLLVVRAIAVGAFTINWSATTKQGSVIHADGVQSGSADITPASGDSIVPVTILNLPPRKLGSAGKVVLTLSGVPGGLALDEAWLFNLDAGRLTMLNCGISDPPIAGASNRLWLDAPSIDSPVPGIYEGYAADRSDSYAPANIQSFGNHEFLPPLMSVFTVTSNATAAEIVLSHYPRFHTHVAAA